MRDAMVPRGPDGFGLSEGPGFALGHRRLAIIDLSAAGRQPMANGDGSVQVTFNGEIYNFLELRRQLEGTGHRFRSRSDTEVLLHGYEAWGFEGLLRRVRGMYAFALVDTRAGAIHLARDPLGKKPLFFRLGDGELAFASEPRALARGLPAVPAIDPAGVDDLLWNLYIPGPRTIFVGVEKLLPGHALSLGRDGRRRDLVHWRGDFFHPEAGVPEGEWLERVEAALEAAVRRRLVADVPVGILLSGGVDSGLVAALAARAAGRVRTFSVASDDPALDESRFARAVAERYGTEHHELKVQSSVRQDLPDLVATLGEPLADTSAANVFAIARLARQSVTVALTGDGGDEAFGGYRHYLAYHLAGRVCRLIPRPFRPPLARLARALRRGPGPVRRLGTFLHRTAAPLHQVYREVGRISAATRQALFTPELQRELNGHLPTDHYLRALEGGEGAPPVDRVMQLHLHTELADDFLPKVDWGTMGASLEARCPFLDLDVVELALRIPARVRFHRGQRKGLLRALARRFLPAEVVDRRKQGFAAPVGNWLGRADWSDLVDDLVLGPQVEQRGWFRRAALQRLVDEQRRGYDRGQLLWALAVLELWIRLGVGGTPRPGDRPRTSPLGAAAPGARGPAQRVWCEAGAGQGDGHERNGGSRA
jgi:asparagine synthase (glutamine-hydrolysing)